MKLNPIAPPHPEIKPHCAPAPCTLPPPIMLTKGLRGVFLAIFLAVTEFSHNVLLPKLVFVG